MNWTQIDPRLKKLHNAIVTAHSETVSQRTALQADEEVWSLLEELTNELNKSNVKFMGEMPKKPRKELEE
jgi:hypothetical protein